MVSHIKLIENRYSCKVSSLLRRPLHWDFSTFWQEETFAGNKVTSQCNGRNSSWPSDIVQQKRAFDRKRFCKLTKISDSLIIKIKNNFCWKIHQYFIRSKRYKVPCFLSFCKLIFLEIWLCTCPLRLAQLTISISMENPFLSRFRLVIIHANIYAVLLYNDQH